MKLLTIGYSITKGTFTELGDKSPNSVAMPNFSQILKEKLGFSELYLNGTNGVSVSRTSWQLPEHAISLTVKNSPNADVVLVCAGTNDYGTDVELGSRKDKEDVSFYGGLSVLYTYLKENFIGSKIFVVSPINRENDSKNKKGYTLNDYRSAVKIRAEEFGFYFIDGSGLKIYPKIQADKELFMPDGLHPNQAGHYLYANFLLENIRGKI